MPVLELFDETLDINSTENYELSVQVCSDDISFCILDTLRNKFVLFRSYEPEDNSRFDPYRMSEIIKKDDFLTRQYKRVNVLTPSPKSTTVPASLFEESRKVDYFNFNQIPVDGETIRTNILHDPDLYVLYSLAEGVLNVVSTVFPGSSLMHQLKPLFQHIVFGKRTFILNNIHVHLEAGYMNMIIFDQSSLIFCNTFHYKTISDIQYYVMYVLRRMKIRQEETVYFSGKGINEEEVMHGLSSYLSSIRFALPSGNFTFSYVINESVQNKYLVLFNTVNCE